MRGEHGQEPGFLLEARKHLEARSIETILLCWLGSAEVNIALSGVPRLDAEIVSLDPPASELAI